MAQCTPDRNDWQDRRPQTEEEAEAMQAESDRLMDRIEARLAREGGDERNYDRILHEELERRRRERGEPDLTPEEQAERAQWIDEMNRAATEALADPDPEVEAELEHRHPLYLRASQFSLRLHRDLRDSERMAEAASHEHPMIELVHGASCAAAKLAGALNGYYWPPDVHDCAGIIVRLKRARGYLDDSLLAAVACAELELVAAAWLDDARRELEELGREIDGLLVELRSLLGRGFD
jgi:hypothetical protein